MIDMKLSSGQAETLLSEPEPAEYPYGLRISLGHEELQKLGINEMPALDSEHRLVALVCVVGTSVTEDQSSEKPMRSLQLQIEQMSLSPAKEEDEADRLYG